MVNWYLVERSDASWVSVRVHPLVEGEQHDMIVGEQEEGSKTSLHMVVDIDVHHKQVTGGHKGGYGS
jgi:hypothetical protein